MYSTNKLIKTVSLIGAIAFATLHPTARAVDPPPDAGYQSLHRTLLRAIYEKAKLTPADEGGNWFGDSVAVSKNLAIIGAPWDFENGEDSGAAYVFAFDGLNWTQQAKLLASDGAELDTFGDHVAISGNLALVGAPFNSSTATDTGAAYAFAFDGTSWIEQAKLTPSDGAAFDLFGRSLALLGNIALIGDEFSAHVFVFDGVTWREQAKLVVGGPHSISLSGRRALIGTVSDQEAGAAYVFAFDGSTWTQEAKLTASDAEAGDWFGASVSLSGDRALIGAPSKDTPVLNAGAAYVFRYDGSTWSQEAKLPVDTKQNDSVGWAVGLSGTRAIVGAIQGYPRPGEAYVFSFDQDTWKLQTKLLASDGAGWDNFGCAIGLSGTNLLVGARYEGAAYVFSLPRR